MKPIKIKRISARPVLSSKKASEIITKNKKPNISKEEKLRIINDLAGMWADKDDSFFDLGKK